MIKKSLALFHGEPLFSGDYSGDFSANNREISSGAYADRYETDLSRKTRLDDKGNTKHLIYLKHCINFKGSLGSIFGSFGRPGTHSEDDELVPTAIATAGQFDLQIPQGPTVSIKGQFVISVIALTFIIAFTCEKAVYITQCIIERLNRAPDNNNVNNQR